MSLKQTTQLQQFQFGGRDAYVIFCRQCGPVGEISGSNHVPYEFKCPMCGMKGKVAWRRRHYRPRGKQVHLRVIEVVHVKSFAFLRFMEFFQQKQEVRKC